MKREQYPELIRLLATLLVVMGHSTFFSISTTIPGMGFNITDRIIDDSNVHRFLSIVVSHIYTYHMPLFFSLSGTIYQICLNKGKYQSFSALAVNKTKRLIIPYAIVSILYNIPILFFTGFFGYDNTPENIFMYFIGFGKNHLWFLIALFLIFLIVHLVQVICIKHSTLIAVIVGILLLIGSKLLKFQFLQTIYLDRVLNYTFYFVLGMILWKHLRYNTRTKEYVILYAGKEICINRFIVLLPVASLFLVLTIGWHFNNEITQDVLPLVTIAFIYMLVMVVQGGFTLEKKGLFRTINQYSTDIFFYGVPVNYIILSVIANVMHKEIYVTNVQSIALVLTRFLLQIIIPISIGLLVKRVKAFLNMALL